MLNKFTVVFILFMISISFSLQINFKSTKENVLVPETIESNETKEIPTINFVKNDFDEEMINLYNHFNDTMNKLNNNVEINPDILSFTLGNVEFELVSYVKIVKETTTKYLKLSWDDANYFIEEGENYISKAEEISKKVGKDVVVE